MQKYPVSKYTLQCIFICPHKPIKISVSFSTTQIRINLSTPPSREFESELEEQCTHGVSSVRIWGTPLNQRKKSRPPYLESEF